MASLMTKMFHSYIIAVMVWQENVQLVDPSCAKAQLAHPPDTYMSTWKIMIAKNRT